MIDYDYLRDEYAKCYTDKSRVYMISHYLKTYDATQSRDVAFSLFPKQQELCRTLASGNNAVCTKARQMGITTTCGGYISAEICLADPSAPQTVLCIGNTLDLAQQMLFKIKDFLLQYPLWMWGDEYIKKGYNPLEPPSNKNIIFEICNGKELKLFNGCRVVARSSGIDASRGVGGVKWLIFDEAAFIDDGKDVFAAALPTVSVGGHVIMISTPNGRDSLYYETFRRAKLNGTPDWNGFEAVEMRWFQDPRYNKFLKWTKKDEETGEVSIIEEPTIDNDGSVPYDDEKWQKLYNDGWSPTSPWYIKMCQQFNHDEQKIAQELDVSFLGSADNVVRPEYIDNQRELNVRDPLYKDQLVEDTWVWKEPINGHRYILSVDNSRGDASDRTAIEIVDVDAEDEHGLPCFEQVLEYNGKKTGDDIGEMVNDYGRRYGNAYVIVEDIGGQGTATILMLQRLGYPNLYYDDPHLNKFTMQREATTTMKDENGRLPGFHSSHVRYQMLAAFAGYVKTGMLKIHSSRTVAELDTWVYKNGRQDHMDGAHDDTLTCLAMGLFVYQYNMNALEEAKNRDKAMLNGFISAAQVSKTNIIDNTFTAINNRFGTRGFDPRNFNCDPLVMLGYPKLEKVSTAKSNDAQKSAYMWVVG